jgi:hypothetical protein
MAIPCHSHWSRDAETRNEALRGHSANEDIACEDFWSCQNVSVLTARVVLIGRLLRAAGGLRAFDDH